MAGPYGALSTPSLVTIAVTIAAGVRSWSGFRIWLPCGAIRVPAARRTDPGRPSSIVAASPFSVAVSSAVAGAQTRNGTPAACAASASG